MKAKRILLRAILCLVLLGVHTYLYLTAHTQAGAIAAVVGLFFSFAGAALNLGIFVACNVKSEEKSGKDGEDEMED